GRARHAVDASRATRLSGVLRAIHDGRSTSLNGPDSRATTDSLFPVELDRAADGLAVASLPLIGVGMFAGHRLRIRLRLIFLWGPWTGLGRPRPSVSVFLVFHRSLSPFPEFVIPPPRAPTSQSRDPTAMWHESQWPCQCHSRRQHGAFSSARGD